MGKLILLFYLVPNIKYFYPVNLKSKKLFKFKLDLNYNVVVWIYLTVKEQTNALQIIMSRFGLFSGWVDGAECRYSGVRYPPPLPPHCACVSSAP